MCYVLEVFNKFIIISNVFDIAILTYCHSRKPYPALSLLGPYHFFSDLNNLTFEQTKYPWISYESIRIFEHFESTCDIRMVQCVQSNTSFHVAWIYYIYYEKRDKIIKNCSVVQRIGSTYAYGSRTLGLTASQGFFRWCKIT